VSGDLLPGASKSQRISLVCHELLSSPADCLRVLCANMPATYHKGELVMEDPDVGGFPPKTWQRKTADH